MTPGTAEGWVTGGEVDRELAPKRASRRLEQRVQRPQGTEAPGTREEETRDWAERQLEVEVASGAGTGSPGDTGTWHNMT